MPPAYVLPQALTVQPQNNRVPPFELTVRFSDGALVDQEYQPGGTNALWTLVGTVARLTERIVFAIDRRDTDLHLVGYGDTAHGYCLLQFTGDPWIDILGTSTIDPDRLDLVEITDPRWGFTFFVPTVAFTGFEDMVRLGTAALQEGSLTEHIRFSQRFADLGLPDGYC